MKPLHLSCAYRRPVLWFDYVIVLQRSHRCPSMCQIQGRIGVHARYWPQLEQCPTLRPAACSCNQHFIEIGQTDEGGVSETFHKPRIK